MLLEDIIITLVIGALVSALVAIIVLWVEKRYSIMRLQTESSNWLRKLNSKHYINLASYSGHLSHVLQDKRLPENELLIEWCLYLIHKYVDYGEKFRSVAGIYLIYSVEGARAVSNLSQLMYNRLLDCFKESLQELAKLGDLEFFEFKECLRREHKDIVEKFREWIRYEKNRRELVMFSYLYSELLNAEVLSIYYGFHYWKLKRVFCLKSLYKNVKSVIELYESKEVIKRNIDELTKIVNEPSEEYGDKDVCKMLVSDKLLVFEKRFFRFVIFGEFPWIIYVKKAEKGVEPLKKFEYETKYKNIEEALEKSQKRKKKIEGEINDFL